MMCHRPHLLLALLTGCASATDSATLGDGTVDVGHTQGEVGAVALVELNGLVTARLPLANASVRFDTAGPIISSPAGETFAVDTVLWGSTSSSGAVVPAVPRVRDCEPELTARTGCLQRVEYDRGGGLVEWWTTRENGLEQGWTVASAPSSEDHLFFEMDVAGDLSIRGNGTSARIIDTGGRHWLVGGIAAWDASGADLPARLTRAGGNLRVEVDVADAVWPVTVDPIYETASTILLGGEYINFGIQVAGGDFNGDGYDDLVVETEAGAGALYVFHGSATGLDSARQLRILTDPGETAIQSVQGETDLNGDGYEDLVVGRGYTLDVHYGSAAGLGEDADLAIAHPGSFSSSYFGAYLDPKGDLDGDGYNDLIVGYRTSYTGDADVGVAYGGASGMDSSLTILGSTTDGADFRYAGDVNADGLDDLINGDVVLVTDSSGAGWSSSVSLGSGGSNGRAAGDVDGDGYDDVMTTDTSSASYTGAVYIYYGNSTGVDSTASSTLTGASTQDYFGYDATVLGDLDGDGDDELLASAPFDGSYGTVHLHKGSPAGVAPSAASTYTSGLSTSAFGTDIQGGLDFNGDGLPDAAFSLYYYNDYQGAVLTYLGTRSGALTVSTSLVGNSESDGYGEAVALVGDIDGDGYDDALVGASLGGTYGRAFVYLGASSGLELEPATTLTGTSGYYFGYSVAEAGDVNADGYDDFIVGAYRASRAYVYYGSASGASSSSYSELTGYTYLGQRTAGAGDVDGDGYDDVLASAYSFDRAYLYTGSSSGTVTSTATSFVGTPGDDMGRGMAGVGDLNGDGYDDIALGAPEYSTGRGAVYVHHGRAIGVSTTPVQTLLCPETTCEFGEAVDGADLDQDGFSDIVVGAPDAETSGAVYIYMGSTTGVAWYQTDSVVGDGTLSQFGSEVQADDLDADAYPELIVAAVSSGVQVFGGSSSGFSGSADHTLSSTPAYTNPGYDISAGHDVDNDGYNDLFVGGHEFAALYRGYRDDDGDGIGSADDCDDNDASIGGPSLTGYPDTDGDGYGDAAGEVLVCAYSSAYVSDDTDCDDADATVHPTATEGVGDSIDQDCDGVETCYVDADDDGYRPDSTSTTSSSDTDCDDSGEAADTDPVDDCDDSDATSNPGGSEAPEDGIDQDCDGMDTCIVDADDDGYVADTSLLVPTANGVCTDSGEGQTTDPDGDCDDADATIHPGATELAGDGVDQDCDLTELCYTDVDGDGYRPDDLSTVSSDNLDCSGTGEATSALPTGDCDDTNAAFNPDEVELAADGLDQNCDGAELCYTDADDDGYARTDGTVVSSADLDCTDSGEAEATDPATDCDDSDPATHPTAREVVGDEVDQNCDGGEICFEDFDLDGYRTGYDAHVRTSSDVDCTDAREAHVTTPEGDCDDDDRDVHPGARESVADGVDSDCDGFEECYVDADGDNWTPGASERVLSDDMDCTDPGESSGGLGHRDCDDSDASIHPDAEEIPGDEFDQNCDDSEECFVDADGDGYRPDESTTVSSEDIDCTDDGEAVAAAPSTDCDDTDASTHPDATDTPGDGLDQDCDGEDAVGEGGGDGDGAADESDEGASGGGEGKGGGCSSAGGVPATVLGLLAVLPAAMTRRRRQA